ncbi:MAG: HAMP domain-containing histidine kinase [Prosthecobacter sp.]|jgi:signal transduction histidine kinase|uniref:sensor histidine kinase n=1 Tax=Prosthecobacter sp. TaxID=1965333 RepID=UPI0019F3BB6D|nr:HAMP domain-containing sensor histidine kinase [Prosthecobacter sp.]MBE2281964.1 HAMP domain-containing histidine kinase [Prosthecobacter sp.]
MRKPLHIGITFLACFGLLLAAMAWVGWHTLALEREREGAAREGDKQERVRLALWRLDFQASALLMRENARPPHDFRPFHSPEGLVSKSYSNVAKGEVLVPSPLLAEVPEHVLLHFQMDSRGQVMSPQVPQKDERSLALAQFINADDLARSEQRLAGLRELLIKPVNAMTPPEKEGSSLWRGASRSVPARAPAQDAILNKQLLAETACVMRFEFDETTAIGSDANAPRNAAWNAQQGQSVALQQQTMLNSVENLSRNRAVTAQAEEAIKQQPMIKMKEPPSKTLALKSEKAAAAKPAAAAPLKKEAATASSRDQAAKPAAAPQEPPMQAAAAPAAEAPPAAPAPVSSSMAGSVAAAARQERKNNIAPNSSRPFQGVWLGDNLILTREAFVDGVRMVQGVWLDWPALRSAWLREITDLFPDAKLEPAANANIGAPPIDDPLRFAALPVRLIPGTIQLPPLPFWTPLRKSLAIALACVLLAAAAVGLVLFGTVALSERRAAFVSAVTHELRTPLTTFRLYSEMLADGMVTDEAQRKTYLDTLTGEAGRLSHLVENVLSYARLERGSAKARAENITIGELLDRILPRLKQRADDCGMEVRIHATESDRKTPLHVDAAAVEQILFNLVDNACKYAAPRAAEPVIHVEADTSGKFAMLRVRDHGAGISRSERRRIFHPFHKSADQAAHSAPGVGLGLALCRRLATALGGAITLDTATKDGACFVLRLPK